MTLPPLANLFCAFDEDPGRLEAVASALTASGELVVWRPAPGWVAGLTALPGGPVEFPGMRAAGLAFCEGADRVLGGKPDRTPASVAALAFNRPDELASLPGDFTFLAFGPGSDLTVVRSCGGLVPVYVLQGRGAIMLGTRLDYFARFPLVPPRLDPLVNAMWATGWPVLPDRRTFLQDVSLIERGTYLRVKRAVISGHGRYWDPRPQRGERITIDPERPNRLRELLIETLRRDLDPAGGNLLTLSGGVDSSALAVLAAGTLGLPIAALSFLPEHAESRARDERYVDALAARHRFEPHRRVVLDVRKRIELLSRPSGACWQIAHPALCMLEEMRADSPVRVLVGGEFADEMVGTIKHFPDWAVHTSLRQLLATGPAGWPNEDPKDLLRWARRRGLHALRCVQLPAPPGLPEFVRPEIHAEYREWRDRRRRAAGRDRRPLRQLAMSTEHDAFVAMNWEAASPLGIRRSLPFFSREVFELAFACHPTELLGPGSKKLLRTALEHDVPAQNLQRRDNGCAPSPVASPLRWSDELDEGLATIVREEWFPRPPIEIDPYAGVGLAQLAQIARSLRARVGQRQVAVGPLAGARERNWSS